MSEKKRFGMSDDEVAALPLHYRDDLFANRVALVSGAGQGIGKAIAFHYARLGAALVVCGRNAERLEAAADALRSRFGAEVRSEMEKVTWPTQEDLKASTTVVMMFLALFAAIVGVMDVVLQNVVLWMFKLT